MQWSQVPIDELLFVSAVDELLLCCILCVCCWWTKRCAACTIHSSSSYLPTYQHLPPWPWWWWASVDWLIVRARCFLSCGNYLLYLLLPYLPMYWWLWIVEGRLFAICSCLSWLNNSCDLAVGAVVGRGEPVAPNVILIPNIVDCHCQMGSPSRQK